MVQLICSEFDEFEEALYGVQGRYVLRTRQQRDWQLNVVDLNGVALMSGREGAGTVYTGIGLPGYFNIFVPLTAHESTVVDGHAFNHRRVGWMVPNAMFHINAKSPASWLTVAMSCELVLRWAAIREDEFDFSLLHRNLVSNAQRHLGPLLWLARRLFHIDAHAPQALHTDAAEQAARTEVMGVVFRLLLPVDPVHAAPRHNRDHKDILRRALELLDTLDIQSVYTEDICQATCASERTVRNVFNEYLGMSPHRYLMIRRLHAIRAAIRHAGPEDTITHICARFGVWDFGRFASLYRQYFGTLPAQSLKAAKALSHL
ncbi:AraC family transcriptional regulator [Pseudomonas prosekii]|uniref:AraC family transcriptional regulator, ethanolamine operon transcriptional activator n=1 Tax=Pseudomonas prosekii TaxID=1148509 RepID=A0A1H2BC57_9PSED|nr:AraC family transcriptional regulator [Pseudomonas prosekii]SDT55855.1 AraC family transcriptional regulator, ethanolamine operon transcriptional activator [Pseudomonas prosekii]